ncbi:MAG: hypothetical protein IPH35_18300 [Rhodoferax sp.]|nr:hypothetical protein [Rhodoferax sp.]
MSHHAGRNGRAQYGFVGGLAQAPCTNAGRDAVHQFRMIDPSQRGLTLIEQAPDDLVEEVRARVATMLD